VLVRWWRSSEEWRWDGGGAAAWVALGVGSSGGRPTGVDRAPSAVPSLFIICRRASLPRPSMERGSKAAPPSANGGEVHIFWTAFFMKFSWCICLNWFLFQVILYSGAIVHALCWLWCFQMNVVGSHVRLMVLNCHINKY
jgi:hypothetical protein